MNFDEVVNTLESGENLAAEVPAKIGGCRAFVGILAFKETPLGVFISKEKLASTPLTFRLIRVEVEPLKLEYDVHDEDLSVKESFITQNPDDLQKKLKEWVPDDTMIKLMYLTDFPL